MTDTNRPKPNIQRLQSEVVLENPWYRVRKDSLIWPNGTRGSYNVIEAEPSVFVVPVTVEGLIVLIHQFRYATQRWVWEIPAGATNPGQTQLEAVAMELREETGGVSDDVTFLGEFELANGRSDARAFIYLARNVVLGKCELESAEIITTHPTTIEQVQQMLATNQIKDAPSALALHLALARLNQGTSPS